MNESFARKRLFTETHRRRPYTGTARPRLLGGQALAAAQRLSRSTMQPRVLGYIQFVADLLSIGLTGLLAHSLVADAMLGPMQRAGAVWMAALCVTFLAKLLGGYGFRRMRSLRKGLAVGLVSLGGGLLLTLAALGWAGMPMSTLQVWGLYWGLAAGGLMGVSRVAMRARVHHLVRAGILEHRIVLVGGGADIEPLIREIDRERGRGRRLCGFFDERMGARSPATLAGHHKTGDIDDLVEFARLAKIDTVIIAIPGASQARIRELLARLFVLPVDIRVTEGTEIPDYSRKKRSKIGPIGLIEIYKRPIGGFAAVEKRIFDLFFASLAILMLSPVMLITAIAIKLDSPGPVLFRQKRHGYNNKPISVLKFRSMYTDLCDPTAVKAVRKGDARVTRVGRFIRRASIDEFPQFFNVIKGDLSMVGPRPHATAARTGDIVYDQIEQAYSARHKVKPGVTGWAQVKGWRGEMNSMEKITQRIEHDLYYIEHWSLWLDLKIVLMTPVSLVTTKNAY
ncbi:undecaprenyl-phosphate glucose phosphotransferase [Pararhodobacter marinus]|uniref:Undecaprenyl-phosphate glucose phosphotransferase n=1 Tax=Pararhodobacter marinus TaxID=2184063 RepID=A0A2U2C9N5_9RHOB|nr:undecaprenyl-phosphate glucose phosphotransferase [Pararhodobacter marinus]PWE28504.1 undecaprenyl-phosphate glucose phosphotransferase [Pararhodobacter marinus]